MYGLPVDLSADEFVQLTLNLPRARMWDVYKAALASDVSRGEAGPIEYYELFAKDRASASAMLGDQVLRGLMGI